MKRNIIILLIVFTLFNVVKVLKININIPSLVSINRVYSKESELKLSDESLNLKILSLESDVFNLKKELNLNNSTSSYKMINATVISTNMKNITNEITIDKGYKDNIRLNDTVINSEGLLGKVVKVSLYSSIVKLITASDINNMISVTIHTSNKDIYGILSNYDYASSSFTIEGIDDLAKVSVGDLVTTTGLTEKYVKGLIIGTVVRISRDNFDLAYILKIKPAVDFNDISYVAVLKNA